VCKKLQRIGRHKSFSTMLIQTVYEQKYRPHRLTETCGGASGGTSVVSGMLRSWESPRISETSETSNVKMPTHFLSNLPWEGLNWIPRSQKGDRWRESVKLCGSKYRDRGYVTDSSFDTEINSGDKQNTDTKRENDDILCFQKCSTSCQVFIHSSNSQTFLFATLHFKILPPDEPQFFN
jgi:hypothetical protein